MNDSLADSNADLIVSMSKVCLSNLVFKRRVLSVAMVGVVFVRIRFETMRTGRSGLAAVVLPIA